MNDLARMLLLDARQNVKTANFGALAAQAVGKAAQGVGTAISAGAANPALAGAAIGATTGAITAGEGNRISGALAGGALGAGAGAGLAKLAPQATQNLSRFGQTLSGSGTGALNIAGKENATFISAMKPFEALKTTRGNFAKNDIGKASDITTTAVSEVGNGMSGSQAALMGTGLVGGAGILGGAVASGGNTPQNQANAASIRQRFSNVAMT